MAEAATGGPRSRRGRAPALLLALLPACATPPASVSPAPPRLPVERAYRPPEGPAPPPPSLRVAEPPERAIERLAEALAEADPRLRRGTGEAGVAWLVLTSSGDPEPFLDCGSFELVDAQGRVERLPAARLAVRLPVQPAERREVLLRQLRLDGRLAVAAVPEDGGSRIELEATYVLTRTVDRVALDGRVLDSQRETAAFRTGEIGRLEQGLVCRPNGRLEAAVVEAAERLLTPADASAGAGRADG